MSFKIIKIKDNSVIEVIAMNIDNENNILVAENQELEILKLQDFKDMILGTDTSKLNEVAKERTHRLFKE